MIRTIQEVNNRQLRFLDEKIDMPFDIGATEN